MIVFLVGILILNQAVYSDLDSGVTSGIIWSLAVGALNHEYSETYSSHNYFIELNMDIPAGVKATYEFAHFVHDLTLGILAREVKVLENGETIREQHEWDGKNQGLGASVYGLDPDHDYKIEAYTRLEIRKGGHLVHVPGKAELKVTEFLPITIE